jgi:hypothetical protein
MRHSHPASHHPCFFASPGSVSAQDPLEGVAALAIFPYCKCLEYRCGASPYKLQLSSVKNMSATEAEFCFAFDYVGCAIASPCCLKEVNDVGKVEFASGKF